MPRAEAVGLPEPGPQISAIPRGYQSHFSHAGERIWPETNCYLDLWIETLHALGLDPVPAFACALSADHDGLRGHSLSNSRRICAGSMAWRSPRRSSGCRYWKRCLSTRPGWIPSDNFFPLLAATPYSVRLQRYCDQAVPLGKVASVDSLGTATITASA